MIRNPTRTAFVCTINYCNAGVEPRRKQLKSCSGVSYTWCWRDRTFTAKRWCDYWWLFTLLAMDLVDPCIIRGDLWTLAWAQMSSVPIESSTHQPRSYEMAKQVLALFRESRVSPKRGLDVSCLHRLSAVTGETPRRGGWYLPGHSFLEEKPFWRQIGECWVPCCSQTRAPATFRMV